MIPLITTLIQAAAPRRIFDEVILALFQLQGVHIEPSVGVAGIEQEYVCRDGKQGLGVFPDAIETEVLQILTGKKAPHCLFF